MEQKQTLQIPVPVAEIPGAYFEYAKLRNAHTRFLFKTWGGLGDMVCAEPALRYALKYFGGCELNLWAEEPQLYDHLKFNRVWKVGDDEQPNVEKFLLFWSIKQPESLAWQFMNHMVTHPVDFSSLCMFACQLPIADRVIQLPDFNSSEVHPLVWDRRHPRHVVVHMGKHWPSKTFPQDWWQQTLFALQRHGFKPILIGKELDDNRGYVKPDDVSGCVDLRDKLDLKSMIYLLKNCRYILTNDSAPIHIGAAGDAHIAFIGSCKHPDYLKHWRLDENGVVQWGWRMANLGLDGLWNYAQRDPSKQDTRLTADMLPEGVMEKLLPEPDSVGLHFAKLAGDRV